jgi:hypothetical protein
VAFPHSWPVLTSSSTSSSTTSSSIPQPKIQP